MVSAYASAICAVLYGCYALYCMVAEGVNCQLLHLFHADALCIALVADAPMAAVLQELLGRRYYEVFYPQNGSVLLNSTKNMWLTTCGTRPYNVQDDDGFVTPLTSPPPADASGSPGGPAVAGRRLLQRSDKKW
jgi:hypothetical protein